MSEQDQWRKNLPEDWQGKQADSWDGEVPLKPILWSAGAVAGAVLVAFVFNAWLMNAWDGMRAAKVRQSPLAEARERLVPVSPKLQAHPEAEWSEMKAEHATHLASYGWIDPLEQRVHLPVARAMELVLDEKAGPGTIEPTPDAPVDVPADPPAASEADDTSLDTSLDTDATDTDATDTGAGVG